MVCRSSVALLFVAFCTVVVSGCSNSLPWRFISKTVEHEADPIERISNRISTPILPDVGLSVLWIGHASVLIQIHDKVFLTDPVFTSTVGMVSGRVVEPGIDPAMLSRVDYVLISHIHFDHLSYGSLSELPKEGKLLVPLGAVGYTPEFSFRETREMKPWDVFEEDGVRITAVPARHFAGRYGFDILWGNGQGYTGYVIQYNGKTVYFAGDTGYRDSLFTQIGQRFSIDVALLPIAPIEPRAFMSRVHLDPEYAVKAFGELNARLMIPIHHRTFIQGLEPHITQAQEELETIIVDRGLRDKIYILRIGEQKIVEK
jgi:N-acyl-phosphatidylethanolamine-hydrolysing phospholipase D